MKKYFSFVLLALAAAFSGCGPGSNGGGTIHISATDAPFPYSNVESAVVTLTRIEARSNGNFITLSTETKDIDLTLLRNGITMDLVSTDVPPGDYDQIRLIVTGGKITMTDGTSYDLKVPSGAQTGIKVDVSPAIHVDTQLSGDLVLDFNLAKSFVPQGGLSITGFHFDPVIRAVNMTTAGTLDGAVTGTKNAAVANATVSVSQNGTEVTQTATDNNGQYKLIGLPAGNYDVAVTADGYTSFSQNAVAVNAGNVTTLNVSLQAPAGPTTASASAVVDSGLYGAPEHIQLQKGYSRTGGGGSSPLMTYKSGGVLNANKTMAIFWGTQWTSATFAGDKITGLDQFFTALNASRYANTGDEYYDIVNSQNLYCTGSSTYLGHVIDSTAAPTSALNTSSAVAEACKMVANNPDPNALYLIYTSTGAGHVNYCAWHSWGTCSNGALIQVAYMPNIDGIAGCNPSDTSTTHSEGLAALANVTAHELMETVTDPRGKGWTDSSGNENGDKCAWSFPNTTGGLSTLSDGSHWKLQMEWSNAAYTASAGQANTSGQLGCIF